MSVSRLRWHAPGRWAECSGHADVPAVRCLRLYLRRRGHTARGGRPKLGPLPCGGGPGTRLPWVRERVGLYSPERGRASGARELPGKLRITGKHRGGQGFEVCSKACYSVGLRWFTLIKSVRVVRCTIVVPSGLLSALLKCCVAPLSPVAQLICGACSKRCSKRNNLPVEDSDLE